MPNLLPFLLMMMACIQLQAQSGKPAFLVYLGSFDTEAVSEELREFDPIELHKTPSGAYEFYAGAYGDEALADSTAAKAQSMGYLEARVITYTAFAAQKQLSEALKPEDDPRTKLGLPDVAGGKPVSVSNLFFSFDSARLTAEARSELNKLVTILRADTAFSLEVRAHCDALGDELYNIHLSERRRDVVVNYLVRHGVANDRIEPHIFGEANPIATNDDRESRKYNRRVELVVIDPGK